MSLARTLLSGVTESNSIDTSDYSFDASMESYYLDAAIESLVSDIYRVDREYHVADIVGEVQVIKEGADGEVILENMFKNGIEKIKEAFRKFLAKIQEWFNKVVKYFKTFFLKGKAFVKEFGNELGNKKVDGFKYNGYNYNKKAGDDLVANIMNHVDNRVTGTAGDISKIDGKDDRDYDGIKNAVTNKSAQSKWNSEALDAIKTGDDLIDEVLGASNIKGESISDMTDEINQAYRNGDDESSVIEDFGANSVKEMLDVIGNDKFVSDVEKAEANFEKDVKAIISALSKIKEPQGKETDSAYRMAQKYSQRATGLLNIGKAALNAKVSAYKAMSNSFQSTLASFARFKPKAEGKDMEDLPDVDLSDETSDGLVEESVLAMAMRLI